MGDTSRRDERGDSQKGFFRRSLLNAFAMLLAILIIIFEPVRFRLRKRRWPRSREAAVTQISRLLSADDQEALRNAFEGSPSEGFQLYEIGAKVRDVFGLWEGNCDLIRDVSPVR